MSQYTSFYIKTYDNKYYPIGTFSRNDKRAAAINDYLPYEQIAPVKAEICSEIIDDLKEQIKNIDSYKKSIKDKIEWLKTAEGSLDERMEMVYELSGDLTTAGEDIPEIQAAIGFYQTLLIMMEEAHDDETYRDERYMYGIKGNSYIYAGIEIGNPNLTYAHDDWGDVIENKITGYKREDVDDVEV